MLPFSDAKEGPLSQLTLSGTKVLTTLTEGIKTVDNAPAEAVEESFNKINLSASPDKTTKAKTSEKIEKTELEKETSTTNEGRKTVIEKLILNVDLKSIEDLNKLKKLLDEIEDKINSNDDDGLQPA